MTRVALYGRVSTPDQDAAPQLARLREWATRQGFEVAMERVDVGSGRLVRRPGMDDVMAAARGHHIHAVAVGKVDRWARSIQHLAASVAEMHDLGVDFHAIDQGLHVRKGDPTSKLILHVLGACAEWEASIISERTKDTLQAKQAAGVRLGRPIKACAICGGARPAGVGRPPRVKRAGKWLPACPACAGKGIGAAQGADASTEAPSPAGPETVVSGNQGVA